jgi:large subunit ribosomal protein L10
MPAKKIKEHKVPETQEKQGFSGRQKSSRFFSEKQKVLKELVDLIQKNKTIMVASIESVPARKFQKIKKELKGKAIIKVLKKSLINLALEKSGAELEPIKAKVDKNFALLLSQQDCFELAATLAELKSNTKIKPGQIAEQTIEIPVGVTDVLAGPAITEFSNAKIKVGIEQGKIAVKEAFVIEKGSKVSPEVALVMERMEIKPVIIGFKPIIAYDSNNKKIYASINIDPKEAMAMIALAASQALNLAMNSDYVCSQTISALLSKANMQAMSLQSKLGGAESQA